MGVTHEVVNVFIGDMRDDRQRHLEMSRAERERLSMAGAREAGENSGDSEIARGREWSIHREKERQTVRMARVQEGWVAGVGEGR